MIHRQGVRLFNIHPGSSCGGDNDVAIRVIASVLNETHRKVPAVVTVLEVCLLDA